MTRSARCRTGRAQDDGRITVKRSWNYAGSHDHKPLRSTDSVMDATLRRSPYVTNKGNTSVLTLTPNDEPARLGGGVCSVERCTQIILICAHAVCVDRGIGLHLV